MIDPVFPLWWFHRNNSFSFFVSSDIPDLFQVFFFFPRSRAVIFSSKSHFNFTFTHSLTALRLWIYRQQMTLGGEIHLIPLITVPVWLSEGQSSFHAWLCLPAPCEAQPMDCQGFTSAVGLSNPCVVSGWVPLCLGLEMCPLCLLCPLLLGHHHFLWIGTTGVYRGIMYNIVNSYNAPKPHLLKFKWQSPLAARVVMTLLLCQEQKRKWYDVIIELQRAGGWDRWIFLWFPTTVNVKWPRLFPMSHYGVRGVGSSLTFGGKFPSWLYFWPANEQISIKSSNS